MNQVSRILDNELEVLKQQHFSCDNLAWIPGGGCTDKPRLMLLFINPTARNISADPFWQGVRYPWIGVTHFWKWLAGTGLLNEKLLTKMQDQGWSCELATEIHEYLVTKRLYITNIVKRTGQDAELPNSKLQNLFLPILKKEIALVKPEKIIAFGRIPFEKLTGQKIKLADVYDKAKITGNLLSYSVIDMNVRVIPCYFPMGRGNPKRATEILKLL